MQTKWNWFERNFDFEFPSSKLPDIWERLYGTPDRVTNFVENLDPKQLHVRETNDSWSVKENVGHLCELEPLWIGRVNDVLAGEREMRVADLTNKSTFEAGYDQQPISELLMRFRSLREELLDTVGKLNAGEWSKSALHPRLKTPMRIVDLCLFVAEHDDYHLARIRYLLKESAD